MTLGNIKVLKGPNIWSTHNHFLLQVRLQTEISDVPTFKYEDIKEKLQKNLQGCEIAPDFAVKNVAELYGHIALTLQHAAGLDASFLSTRPTAEKGTWLIAFEYINEATARYAAEQACEITEALLFEKDFDLKLIIETIREIHKTNRTEEDVLLIAEEARRRNIPVKVTGTKSLQLGYGKYRKVLEGTTALNTTFCKEVDHKKLQTVLKEYGIPADFTLKNEATKQKVSKILLVDGEIVATEEMLKNIHPDNRFLVKRIAQITGLDVLGIEISTSELSTSAYKNGGTVSEINSSPSFSDYLPTYDLKVKAAAQIVDMLFPNDSDGRIPIFGITGTNGKTTTTRLLRHLVKNSGYCVGYTTTDGVYVGDHEVCTGDCTGPASAGIVLRDPNVDFAILETARGGLLRGGLAFDRCDVAIVTNIQEDHLGLNDINNLEDLANVKGVVPRSVKSDGWAILNAEDHHCLNLIPQIEANIALFSLNPQNTQILRHINQGRIAATVEEGNAIIYSDKKRIVLAPIKDFPLTMNGTAKFMTANILAAAAAAFAYGFSIREISDSFKTFVPSAETTPGRMNVFDMKDYKVLVDYAHNTHGVRAVEDYLKEVKASRKIGIVSAVGDRRDKDIIDLAAVAADMFDFIIVRQDSSLRGRKIEEMCALMLRGIRKTNPGVEYMFIDDEGDAVRHAIKIAQTGDFVVALSENYQKVIEIIEQEQPNGEVTTQTTSAKMPVHSLI